MLWDGGNPETGALDEPDSQALLDLLSGHTGTPDDAYFALWEGSGHFNDKNGIMYRAEDAGSSVTRDRRVTITATRLASGPRLHHPGRNYVVLEGALAEACAIVDLVGARPSALSGNLIWPADHAWCVGTEVDFDSTLVGCSRTAAEEILACQELEAVSVGPHDSLQFDADHINA